MQFSVTVSDSFEAAHLDEGNERCGSMHGHSWSARVTLMAETLTRVGEVPGSTGLHMALRAALDPYRDRVLNDKLVGAHPTAAGLAVNLMEQLSLRFPRISSVRVRMGEVEEVEVCRELPR